MSEVKSARPTPGPVEGSLYVYRCADTHDAICVARRAVGPHGGWTADTVAKMPTPSKRLSRDEINAYAALFAEAGTVYHETELTPRELADRNAELLAALRRLAGNAGALGAFEGGIRECAGNTNWQCLIHAIHAADAAIAKAGRR